LRLCHHKNIELDRCYQGAIIEPYRDKTTGDKEMEYTKDAIIELAKEEGMTELELISTLQTFAAKTDNDELLEHLCQIKWEFIK
jgi:hypothetical protein